MKILVLIASFFLFAFPAQAITISDPNFGGSMNTFLEFWRSVAKSGDNVIIDAPCISGCTFFLGLIPENKVCVTPRASLGLHQVSSGSTPNPAFSAALYRWIYPEWVQQWIKDNGGLRDEPIYMFAEDLKGHIKLCPGFEYGTVSPGELINHAPNVGEAIQEATQPLQPK